MQKKHRHHHHHHHLKEWPRGRRAEGVPKWALGGARWQAGLSCKLWKSGYVCRAGCAAGTGTRGMAAR